MVFVGQGGHIRYYNISTGGVGDTGVSGSHPTIYGNTIAFASEGTLHYFDLQSQTLTNTHVPGDDPVIYDHIIAFVSGSPQTIRYYDLQIGMETDTGAVGRDPTLYENTIAFNTEEAAAGVDLNGDGYLRDSLIRFYNIQDQRVTNTEALGAFPAIYGNRIAFSTKESLVHEDLNGDGHLKDWVIRYYDIQADRVIDTGRLGVEPDIYDDTISFWVYESWTRRDLNGDGDRSDPIVQTYRIQPAKPAADGNAAAPLVVTSVLANPNPAKTAGAVRFVVEGQGMQELRVQIYSLAGREIYSSEFTSGREMSWWLADNEGRRVSNGVYLYVVTVKGVDEVKRTAIRKFVVLR